MDKEGHDRRVLLSDAVAPRHHPSERQAEDVVHVSGAFSLHPHMEER
jgi:hypothetical protein